MQEATSRFGQVPKETGSEGLDPSSDALEHLEQE
jgi:hypothetical protein